MIVGTKRALNIALQNNKIAKRNIRLKERIVSYIGNAEGTSEKMQPIL